MKISMAVAAVLHLAAAGHVDVRMPYLNPAGVTYYQGQHQSYSGPAAYVAPELQQAAYGNQHQLAYATQQQLAYEPQNPYIGQAPYDSGNHLAYENSHVSYTNVPAQAYAGVSAHGYASVPVKAAVAVPTVHHVPAVADVPVTKIVSQPAVIQKIVDVAKPAIKTQKYEIRRPAIQKQFYDIEERTIVRPVGSALLELDEPLSQHQTGPAVVSTLEDKHHHHQIPHVAEHGVAIASSPIPHAVAVTPVPHVVAITPSHQYSHESYPEHGHHAQILVSSTPAPIHYPAHEAIIVSSTLGPHHESESDSIFVDAAARHYEQAKHAAHEAGIAHQEAIARANYNAHAHEDAIAKANHQAHVEAQAHEEAVARHNHEVEVNAHNEAVARANYQAHVDAHAHEEAVASHNYDHSNAHLVVESHSNGSPKEHVIIKQDSPVNIKGLNHLSHEEASANQHKLLQLLTARGGVAEIGHERHGGAGEYVGDAGISRARVLSATPSPHHEPIDEKIKTRRIVVSRPVQTLQEIEVVQPATKIEQVAVNHPTVIKTAQVSYERVKTSVPVYGKALAPAIAHAQVPVQYYH